ncbi:Transcriptional regulatory protein ZraR [compost metagenome]|uniref:sigma-54 interaction domain-containing protein n=1 Tax=Clostridium sp. UBA1652 TaxID=1946348 RepID=UPI000FBB3E60|nr:sigma 54-interacting transcriptional regulator [Clostridium sp. UBA1652]
MKESLLKPIQSTVLKYAEVIANVIKVDVEIVDSNLNTIAGTGIFTSNINGDNKGVVYKHVLATGKHQIIENPREAEICRLCNQKNECLEMMEISTPIIFQKEIIGVIGLVCTTIEQKNYLSDNLDSHLEFLYKISELISAKIYEFKGNERNVSYINLLKQVVNSVDNGVIIINSESKIVEMNSKAMKKLELTPSDINGNIQLKLLEGNILEEEFYKVRINGKKYNLVGSLIPLEDTLEGYNKMLIFNMLKDVNTKAYKITSDNKIVGLEAIIGEGKSMQGIKDKIRKIANTKSTVFVTGESGTGKELIARAIHAESDRRNNPFIGINCAAIPDTLLESELFGYVKGAFSGANPNGRIGKFELANKGVIFLDEVGDMPLYLQAKLLRVLQERTLVRIGSNELVNLDIRVVAATNKDLRQMIKENKFREDLYYRLNVIPIEIPALRERREDFKLILNTLIDKYNKIFDKYVHTVNKDAYESLLNYSWPGNIRELENVVELLINLSDSRGIIEKEMLPHTILGNNKVETFHEEEEIRFLKDIEREYILKALDKYGYDTNGKKMVAEKLGIGIATIYRKIGSFKE